MLEDKGWEDPRSVNSPRRILSFSKNRKATVFFPEPDDRDSGFGVSGDQGPKTSEVYGFVGSITTLLQQAVEISGYITPQILKTDENANFVVPQDVVCVLFLGWAYLPEHSLHSLGIVYYPSRYWALAATAYVMMTIVLAVGFYIGLNFLATPPPTSFSMIYDEFTREPLQNGRSTDNDEQPIEHMSDIRIDQINDLMVNPR